ncbi:AAA family ATPase [Burkholderia pseudomallei]|uniref:AAA family ATPase n=1 Tax=Burkholderia pseudomallei TaxID=28450 RepID=UPI00097638F1|nr:AAA family ATPase [Burkholderia pseudomallei]OMR52451.1 AAA family ATPase [Burkholderia pseudomallei]
MNFYKSPRQRVADAPTGAKFPCVVYVEDNWDDYSHKTLFRLYYFRNESSSGNSLGEVKILQLRSQTTKLSSDFTKLDPDEFVSLGQNLEYYKKLRELGEEIGEEILKSLNDVALDHELLDRVETKPGFRNSLIRFNEAKIALRHGRSTFQGEPRAKEHYAFEYDGQIPGASAPVRVKFNLDAHDQVPGRIAAIIGRNGVGKTQFLARLAIDLATPIQMSKQTADQIESAFLPRRPLFSRVIALSFSAFDRFPRPKRKNISYIYCGVRDDSGKLSRTALEAKHKSFLERVDEQDRASTWEKHIATIQGVPRSEVSLQSYLGDLTDDASPSLSSGQSILTYFTSAAVAYLKEGSLLLFDEPEIHLHPAAVAGLMQILHALLDEYDSYAIVATHSPLVVQEVPGRRVIRFSRTGDTTTAEQLPRETFGENLSELTRMIFETAETPSFYKKTLRDLSEEMTFHEVMDLFEGDLSLQASAYLASLHNDTNE